MKKLEYTPRHDGLDRPDTSVEIPCEQPGVAPPSETIPEPAEEIAILVSVYWDGGLDTEYLCRSMNDARRQAIAIVRDGRDPLTTVRLLEVYCGDDAGRLTGSPEPTGYMPVEILSWDPEMAYAPGGGGKVAVRHGVSLQQWETRQ